MRSPGADFDQESALAHWRQSLLTGGGMTVTDLDELEDHLLQVAEELERQLRPEEAFWVAAHRVGTPDALTREYGKIQPNSGWLLRAQWALLGLLTTWWLVPATSSIILLLLGVLAQVPMFSSVAAFSVLFLNVLAYGLVGLGLYLVIRRWANAPQQFERIFSGAGLPLKWTLVFTIVCAWLWSAGFSYVARQGSTLMESVTGGNLASQLPSGVFLFAPFVGYLIPALLILAVVVLQRRRELMA